jgi:hypothetical protein
MASYVSLTASYTICLELCLPLKRNRGDVSDEPELDPTQSKPYYIIEDHTKALIRHILASPHHHCLITNDRPSRNLLYTVAAADVVKEKPHDHCFAIVLRLVCILTAETPLASDMQVILHPSHRRI